MEKQGDDTGAELGFEAQLRAAADIPRGNMGPSDCKHVALGFRETEPAVKAVR